MSAPGKASLRIAAPEHQHFDVSKPTLSKHFAVLKEADLIHGRKNGTSIIYTEILGARTFEGPEPFGLGAFIGV